MVLLAGAIGYAVWSYTADLWAVAVVLLAAYIIGLYAFPGLVQAGGKNVNRNAIIALVIGLVAFQFSTWGPLPFLGGTALSVTPALSGPTAQVPASISDLAAGCGDTKTSTLNITTYSDLNTTGAEGYSVTMYGYEVDASNNPLEMVGTLSTNTNGGSLTVACGKKILLKAIRSDGDHGDNSRFVSVVSGPAVVTPEGDLLVSVGQPYVHIKAKMVQHGIMQARAYDMKETAWIYSILAPGGTATEWISTPANFQSPTNDTDYAVGSGGELHVKYYVRSTRIDTNFNDRGWCIIYNAATSAWDTPTVKINGVTVADSKASLTSDESRKYGAEATNGVYCSDVNPLLNSEVSIEVDQFALPGVDPTGLHNITMTILSRGQFLSKDGVHTKIGLVDDAASPNNVFTPFVISQRVS